jgi:predicted HTH transcriptional regulator
MNLEHIRKLLISGENVSLEYKECIAGLNKDIYQTVCAFLNRFGGELLLGVANTGTITGVEAGKVEQIKKEFVTAINNPTKLSPTTYLTIEEFIIEGKHILYVYVPPSSQVHRVNNRIFDRNEDGDLDITDNTNLVSQFDIVKTNLIESYERLMEFIAKHLPDPFYQDEKANRIILRYKIFREVVSNILIHREYSNPYPAKLIIERAQVIAENSNRPHFHGLINPADFSPFPKNPIIAGFFREIGRAEEFGSGVRNLFRYTKAYSAVSDPQLVEADIFKIIVPLDIRLTQGDFVQANDYNTPQATGEVPRKLKIQFDYLNFVKYHVHGMKCKILWN